MYNIVLLSSLDPSSLVLKILSKILCTHIPNGKVRPIENIPGMKEGDKGE
jgi:hypothetical protein